MIIVYKIKGYCSQDGFTLLGIDSHDRTVETYELPPYLSWFYYSTRLL